MHNLPIILIVNGHQPFVYNQKDDLGFPEYKFFESLSDTYLPLLRLFTSLETDGIPFKLGMCLSPQLCAMLTDNFLCKKYVEFLEWQKAFIERERERVSPNQEMLALLDAYYAENRQNRIDFVDTYDYRILDKFKYYEDRGCIELLGTAASSAFLPLYADMPEILNAQIEIGIQQFRNNFRHMPNGFWLPYMGYSSGLEFSLKAAGYQYTILAGHGLLFGNPVPEHGIFSPVALPNKFAAWGADAPAVADICSLEKGFHINGIYRNQERDVLFELGEPFLSDGAETISRHYSGVKYWSNDGSIYNLSDAKEKAREDAHAYLLKRFSVLREAAGYMDSDPSSVCPLPAAVFGQSWHEGLIWLDTIFRELDRGTYAIDDHVLSAALPYSRIGMQPPSHRMIPLMSSTANEGYAEDWLDNSNEWMCRFSRSAAANMVDLATRFSSDAGLKERALNLAAREVLLSQDADLPLMVKNMIYADSALARFEENISSFSIVYDFLGANTMSTEWLTEMERRHNVFEKVNFRIFKTKSADE